VDNPTYCPGSVSSITLSASGGSGTALRWYSGSCGGALVGTGTSLTIPAPSVSTTYFARWESGACGNSACAIVAVAVAPPVFAPTSITTSANNYCPGSVGSLVLTAIGGSGPAVEWFESTCGGSPIGTGNPLVLPAPSVTKTYLARYTSPTCGPSACASIIVTVDAPTGACCTGWGIAKACSVVDPINCQGPATPSRAYRGNCTTCSAGRCCTADYNNNGTLEILDIFDYLDGWFAGDITADFNHSGGLQIQDIFDFLNAWFAGC
jgi:hypothetical protein